MILFPLTLLKASEIVNADVMVTNFSTATFHDLRVNLYVRKQIASFL